MEVQELSIQTPATEDMPWLRRLGGTIISPRTTLGYLADHPDWRAPVFLILITNLISLLPIIRFSVIAIVTIGIIAACLVWVVKAGGIWLLAKLFRGEGKFYPFLSVIGYTMLPSFLQRFVFSWLYMGSSPLSPVLGLRLALSLISWAFLFWTLGLTILGISVVSKFRLWKAAITFCLLAVLVSGTIFTILRKPSLNIMLLYLRLIVG